MDVIYDNDRKLGVFEEESDMSEYFDQDVFTTAPTSISMEAMEGDQWFDSLFTMDPPTFSDKVLNDRSLTDAAQPPCIKSEHSYSLNDHPSSPLGLTKLDDFETDLFKDMALDLTGRPGAACSHSALKQESLEFDLSLLPTPAPSSSSPSSSSSTSTAPGCPAPSPHPASLLLTSSALETGMDVSPTLATIVVKQEPPDTFDQSSSDQTVNVDCISMDLPPTPPSSGGSDSDGSLSPTRSAPSSPIRSSSSRQHSTTTTTYSQLSSKSLAPHSLFLSPIPQSGTLQLTEEEKRTLVSEGYSIPAKLPLTKQEEKNLKKIRRKIKNKISAQESRRKKKEYLEALEKKCEAFTHENTDLRKKVDSLESNNRSLLSQLQKLQDFVSKMPRAAATATQTSTVVMVLVLSFAVFLGSWGSASFNIGYSSGGQALGPLFSPQPNIIHPAPSIGPKVGQASVGEEDYSTPNLKSRVLLSVREEGEELEGDDFWPQVPWSRVSVCDAAATVHPGAASSQPQHPQAAGPGPSTHSPPGPEPGHPRQPPSRPVVTMVMTASGSNNESQAEFQATMHPDIAAAVPTPDARGNLTAELETA